MKTQKIRQILILSYLFIFSFQFHALAQGSPTVDYSKASNILDPDTLKGDNKAIFWHFVELTHEETKNLEPADILNELNKLGIFRKERARFVAAYGFVRISMTNHKKSCENWSYFEFLKP